MSELVSNRCLNHNQRKAVAKCPSCQRDFCQECITEHRGRLICVSCLQETQVATSQKPPSNWGKKLASTTFGLVSLTFLFLLFYFMGRILAAIPQSFHENMVF
jgi:hypothetical protein